MIKIKLNFLFYLSNSNSYGNIGCEFLSYNGCLYSCGLKSSVGGGEVDFLSKDSNIKG